MAEDDDAGGGHGVKDPTSEDYSGCELVVLTGKDQYRAPDAEPEHGLGGGSVGWVNFGDFFEEKPIFGHGVRNAATGEDAAIQG